MSKKGHSEPNLFGGYTHYDENGKKIGRSEPGIFGGYTEYDAKGHKIGRTEPGMFGDYKHYDAKGHRTGTSRPDMFGGYNHYDKDGHKVGSSDPNLIGGGYHHNSSSNGCYIATCVYNSYDCPEVWTLRRFRDQKLAETIPGRIFIRAYYATSPTLVRWFGQKKWFRLFWRKHLNRMVSRLQNQGFSDEPYNDPPYKK